MRFVLHYKALAHVADARERLWRRTREVKSWPDIIASAAPRFTVRLSLDGNLLRFQMSWNRWRNGNRLRGNGGTLRHRDLYFHCPHDEAFSQLCNNAKTALILYSVTATCGNCTSIIERSNLSVRMGCHRFTRFTNAFSKEWENRCAAVTVWYTHYNFCRIHKSLRVTPAMEAGIADRVGSVADLLA